jgi:hypothetical protein
MKYGLLLGMAIILGFSFPAMGSTLIDNADTVIIGTATFTPGQTQVSVPVYFVTDGDVTHYNLPLRIESTGDIQFMGFQVGPPLEPWDDNWQGIKEDHRLATHLGFSDLGGDPNPSLNTNGLRAGVFELIFSISENPTTRIAAIIPAIDDRTGAPLFGYSDGVTGVAPVIINGSVEISSAQSVDDSPLPTEILLSQNYPNPFNPTTEIGYALPDARNVKLTVFNILGQNIRSLVSGSQEAGYHKVIWDGKNDNGNSVPSGAYFYKLEAGSFSQSLKMVLLK